MRFEQEVDVGGGRVDVDKRYVCFLVRLKGGCIPVNIPSGGDAQLVADDLISCWTARP